jgi:hypothetical protein
MVISISNKLWNNALMGDSYISIMIKQILNIVETGRHSLLFEGGIDIKKIIEFPDFISYSEIIKAHSKKGFYQGPSEIIVRVTNTSDLKEKLETVKSFFDDQLLIQQAPSCEYQYLDLTAVQSYLIEPLYIVVENLESDATFIKCIYSLMSGEELCNIKTKFIHGGGSTTPIVIDSYTSPSRLICVLDSDKIHPMDDLSLNQKIATIMDICEKKYFQLFVLNRREIENYIPDQTLKVWLEKQNRSSEISHEFFEWNNLQKSYFDMKKGIKVKDFDVDDIRDLYPDVFTSEIYQIKKDSPNNILINGFGRDVWKAFGEVSPSLEDFEDSSDELKKIKELIECYV